MLGRDVLVLANYHHYYCIMLTQGFDEIASLARCLVVGCSVDRVLVLVLGVVVVVVVMVMVMVMVAVKYW